MGYVPSRTIRLKRVKERESPKACLDIEEDNYVPSRSSCNLFNKVFTEPSSSSSSTSSPYSSSVLDDSCSPVRPSPRSFKYPPKTKFQMTIVDRCETNEGYYFVVASSTLGMYGYVGVEKDHPLYGKEYDETLPCLSSIENSFFRKKKSEIIEKSPQDVLDVADGITFSGEKTDFSYHFSKNLWWFGYIIGECCSKDGITKECNKLSKQLYKIEKKLKVRKIANNWFNRLIYDPKVFEK